MNDHHGIQLFLLQWRCIRSSLFYCISITKGYMLIKHFCHNFTVQLHSLSVVTRVHILQMMKEKSQKKFYKTLMLNCTSYRNLRVPEM